MATEPAENTNVVFSNEANAVALWLTHHGFAVADVDATVEDYGRISFAVRLGEAARVDQRPVLAEYLTGHDYVVEREGNWSISGFVLLSELDLAPPRGECRRRGCSTEAARYDIDLSVGRARQYCRAHANSATI